MAQLLNSASSSALLFHQIQETRCAELLFNKSAAKGCKRRSGDPVRDLVQFPQPAGMGIQQNQRQEMEVRAVEVAQFGTGKEAAGPGTALPLGKRLQSQEEKGQRSQLLLFPACFAVVFWEAPEWSVHIHM